MSDLESSAVVENGSPPVEDIAPNPLDQIAMAVINESNAINQTAEQSLKELNQRMVDRINNPNQPVMSLETK